MLRFAGLLLLAAVSAPLFAAEGTYVAFSLSNDSIRTFDKVHVSGAVESILIGVTGTVTLFVNDVAKASAPAPVFDFLLEELSEGRYAIRLEYSGDAAHLPSVSPTKTLSVWRGRISTEFTFTPGRNVTFGTTVGIRVYFYEWIGLTTHRLVDLTGTSVDFIGPDGALLGTVPVATDVAMLTTAAAAPGNSIVVRFPGNRHYGPSDQRGYLTIADVEQPSGATSFHTVTPCRVLDTRYGADSIGPNAPPVVYLGNRCGIPYGAKAVALNATVVQPTGTGYITLFGGASPIPSTSTLSYRYGRTRANSAIIPLSAGAVVKVQNSGPAWVHVVLDVTGYFQ